jgi:hypothetical protein
MQRQGMKAVVTLTVASLLVALWNPASAFATHVQACSESSTNNRFAAYYTGGGSLDINGAAGRTDDLTLSVCTSATDNNRANSVWVGVEPKINPLGSSIVQAGRVKCKQSSGLLCNQTNRKFWAWGRDPGSPGCSGWTRVVPTGRLIGSWSSGTDSWIVSKDGSAWHIYDNGGLVDSLSTSSICWSTVGSYQAYAGESWDLGDAIGGETAAKFRLDNAQKRVAGQSWTTAGFTSPCTYQDYPGRCQVLTNTSLDIWADH